MSDEKVERRLYELSDGQLSSLQEHAAKAQGGDENLNL